MLQYLRRFRIPTKRYTTIMTAYATERAVAINAVLQACMVSQSVFRRLVANESITKKDRSPVTVADFSAQAVVNLILHKNFPDDPIVGEEDSGDLRGESGTPLRLRVLELTNTVLDPPIGEEELLQAIDRGSYAGGSKGRMWTLDPIDGTKGFLRGEQYAICLALIVDGIVQLGVVGCPNLPVDLEQPDGEKGCLFIAVKNQGSSQRSISSTEEKPIRFADVSSPESASFCESTEAAHSDHDNSAKIAALLGITKPPVRMDSQCKYCSVSRGDANIYLRLPVQEGYEEKIWDHASGSLLVEEAGGKISDLRGNRLDFSLGRTLKSNVGVIVAHPNIHAKVLEAVQTVYTE